MGAVPEAFAGRPSVEKMRREGGSASRGLAARARQPQCQNFVMQASIQGALDAMKQRGGSIWQSLHEDFKPGYRQRPAKKMALVAFATKAGQQLTLSLCFHAFGHHA